MRKFCWDPSSFWVNVKVSSSEYLGWALLAAIAEVAVRTVTLPNLLLFIGGARFVGFVQIVVDRFSTYRGW